MHAPPHDRLSEAEFLALPETTRRVELVDGEVLVAPAPSALHQEVLRRLVRELERGLAAAEPNVTLLFAPTDVRFGDRRILQPDVALWRRSLALPATGPITTVPDVCVEILSNDRAYDRTTRRAIYADAGVPEYWVVELYGPLELWTGERLSHSQTFHDRIVSVAIPGLEIDLARVFLAAGDRGADD